MGEYKGAHKSKFKKRMFCGQSYMKPLRDSRDSPLSGNQLLKSVDGYRLEF